MKIENVNGLKKSMLHHVSIRTADIFRAIAFYEQLGFIVKERFTTGYTLGCWMEGMGGRIELLQVPQPQLPPDPFGDETYVGYYHLSFDLTYQTDSLPAWLKALKTRLDIAAQGSESRLSPLQVLLEPTQQMIGDRVYEVAFITDADAMPIELLRQLNG